MTLWLLVAVALLAAGAAPRRLGSAAPQADSNSLDAAPPAVTVGPKPPTTTVAGGAEDEDDGDEDTKTLSQQIADGKYGLIQKELYSGEVAHRPGILSYAANPEVPRDTLRTLGGLRPAEVWLAEDHVLVLRGGAFAAPERTERPPWPPIDDYRAPPRQVRLPARPRVPPPFPVQLADGEPPRLLANQSAARRPPFFGPPFPFPGFGAAAVNASQDGAPYPPPGNFPPGGGFPAPAGNGSLSPPPYPFPPPRNGSLYGPPAGPYPPPFFFPGVWPPQQGNLTFPPPFLFPPTRNGTFPFPYPPSGNSSLQFPFPVNGSLPPFFPGLPPGAALLPPPGAFNNTFDEDDMSIYYPPPYDFYYPTDNTTQVPPGPLVPGIILPPPPDFFGPLENETASKTTPPATTTRKPYTVKYVPVTTQNRRKKPMRTTTPVTATEMPILTTTLPSPMLATAVSPRRTPSVQVIHEGASPLQPHTGRGYYYYDVPVTSTVAPSIVIVGSTTPSPPAASITYIVAPVTDILVQSNGQGSSHEQHHKTQQQQHQHTQSPPPQPTVPTYYYNPAGDRSPKKSYYFFEQPWRGLSFQVPLASPTLQTLLGQTYRQPSQFYYYPQTAKQQRPLQPVSTPSPQYYHVPQGSVEAQQAYYPQSTPSPQSYYNRVVSPTPVPKYFQVSSLPYFDVGPSTVRNVYKYNYNENPQPYTTPRPLSFETTPRTLFEFSYQQQQKPHQTTHYSASHYLSGFPQDRVTTPPPLRPQQYKSERTPSFSYTTENPLSALFTRQEERLLDEHTKQYFTVFGQKLTQQGSQMSATTPIPPSVSSTKEEQGSKDVLPLSLEGDTLVNYRPPLPAINPDSEFIAYPLPGNGAHAYFLQPSGGYSYPAPLSDQRLRYRRKDNPTKAL